MDEELFTANKCVRCEERFSTQKLLRAHLISVHADKNYRVCGKCEQFSATSYDTLRMHFVRCNGVRPLDRPAISSPIPLPDPLSPIPDSPREEWRQEEAVLVGSDTWAMAALELASANFKISGNGLTEIMRIIQERLQFMKHSGDAVFLPEWVTINGKAPSSGCG